MPGFEANLEHDLPLEVAFTRLQRFGDQMRANYAEQVSELEETWNDDGTYEFSFKVMGMSVSGNMVTEAEIVRVKGSIPFAALPFRGQLENEIRERLKEALEADHGDG